VPEADDCLRRPGFQTMSMCRLRPASAISLHSLLPSDWRKPAAL
jgi:hypothetical protein